MFGIGGTELAIILIFGFLIFGPDKLPSMGRTIGRALRQFQQAQEHMNKMVQTEIYDPINKAVKDAEKKQPPKKAAAKTPKPETFAEKKARLAAAAQGVADAPASSTAAAAAKGAAAAPAKDAAAASGATATSAKDAADTTATRPAAEAVDSGTAKAETTAAKPAVRTASPTRNKNLTNRSFKLYDIDQLTSGASAPSTATPQTGKGDQAGA